nr:hypothetical protein [Tanacetum cinerariifolium]
YGEEYYSFVNGQYTTQGGTHLAAFREAVVKTVREHYKKEYDAADVRASIIGAISIRVQEPVFESQTKTKLGSINMEPDAEVARPVRGFIVDFLKEHLDNFLHKNPKIAEALENRIKQSERERKDMAGVKKLANQRAKKANLHNRKLRDCRFHLGENAKDGAEKEPLTTLFITEGDSASGSITKSRNVELEAVFTRAQHRGRAGRPALQPRGSGHRCRRGWHAHSAAAAHVFPPVFPRLGAQRPRVHPGNAAFPGAQ